MRPNVTTVVDFLASVFNSGIGYSSLNTLRSALSAAVLPVDGVAMGSHPLVKRLMKGSFNLKPPTPRYSHTWDVSTVLNYLKGLGGNSDLSMKQLTMKLVVLIALVTGQRCQTLSLLNLNCAQITHDQWRYFCYR